MIQNSVYTSIDEVNALVQSQVIIGDDNSMHRIHFVKDSIAGWHVLTKQDDKFTFVPFDQLPADIRNFILM